MEATWGKSSLQKKGGQAEPTSVQNTSFDLQTSILAMARQCRVSGGALILAAAAPLKLMTKWEMRTFSNLWRHMAQHV